MSVESVASGLQSAKLRQQIDVAILKKVQESTKQQGDAAIKLLQSAVQDADGDGDRDNTVGPNHVDVDA